MLTLPCPEWGAVQWWFRRLILVFLGHPWLVSIVSPPSLGGGSLDPVQEEKGL